MAKTTKIEEPTQKRKGPNPDWTERGRIGSLRRADRAPDGQYTLRKYIGLLDALLKKQGNLVVKTSDFAFAIGPEVIEDDDDKKVVVLF